MASNPSADVVVKVIPRGWHGSDIITLNSDVNRDCQKVRDEEVAQIAEWISQ
jgi:hypothetical protein